MDITQLPNAPGFLVLTHKDTGKFYVAAPTDMAKSAGSIKSGLTTGSHHNKVLKSLPGVPDSLTVTYTQTDTHEQAKRLREQYVKRYYGDIRLLNKTNLPILPGTYAFIHLPTQQYYIGYTRDVRFTQSYQMTLLRTNRHKNKTLQALYDENPDPENFGYSFTVTKDKATAKSLLNQMLADNKEDPLLLNEKKTRQAKVDIGAYVITHTPTGHYYLGSSKEISRRWSHHRWQLKNNRHKNEKMQQLYTGDLDDFTLKVTYTTDRKTAYDLEQEWLDTARHDPKCLNVATDARSTITSIDIPEEVRQQSLAKTTKTTRGDAFREYSSRRSKAYWADPENLEKRKGAGNPFAKVIVIGPFVFGSVKDAMHELDIGEKALRQYARDPAHKTIYFPADHYRKVTQGPHTPWEDTEAVKGLIDTLNPLSYGRVPIALDGVIYANTADAQKRTRRDFYEIKQAAKLLPVFCLDSHHRFSRTATLSDVSEIHYPLDKGNSP